MALTKKVFLIGIGGAGMSSLALLAQDLGYAVSGSDLKNSETVKKLKKRGIKVFLGHSEKNISSIKPDLVVYSSAVKNDNPEFVWAQKKKIKTLPRFAFLSQLLSSFKTIAIAGTHGKTTTTSLVGFLLQEAKIPVYVYLGGENASLKKTKITPKSWVVLETDESDKSFLLIDPWIALVTNIDRDHLSNYHYNFKELKRAFKKFLQGQGKRKTTIVCADDNNLMEVMRSLKKQRFLTYGIDNPADLMARNLSFSSLRLKADLYYHQKFIGQLEAPFISEKNLLNSLGAILAAKQIGVNFSQSLKVLRKFTLPKRRTEIIGEKKKILVIDDHADHPTEVKTTLNSLKVFGRRIIAIYEPHRYTRMKMLGEKVGQAFGSADVIISLDICPAFEKSIKGITGKKVNDWIKKANLQKPVYYVKELNEVPKFLKKIVKPNDLVITLGPGTIKGLAQKIYQEF
ncbi:MAG: UDP-N-acetylmuramate--L-alanine ligase [Patescibacteria group bacterium]|nr:UDP-N-acetylmuramate--L-alanine ligase [Patescibacteria group bacterium]